MLVKAYGGWRRAVLNLNAIEDGEGVVEKTKNKEEDLPTHLVQGWKWKKENHLIWFLGRKLNLKGKYQDSKTLEEQTEKKNSNKRATMTTI